MKINFGLHTLNSLSIRKYGIIDQTDSVSLLRRWFNPFPVKWFDTDTFFEQFRGAFNTTDNDKLLQESHRMLSYNNIIILDRVLKMLSLLMANTNNISLFSLIFKQKTKEYKGNFDAYVEKVEKLTGIKIEDGKGLKRLQSEIERLWDKYQERFNKKGDGNTDDRMTFLEQSMIIFGIMGMDYVPEMKLNELASLKILADKKIKQLENEIK